jgi:(E)-4-hydroxy-3-methylbut-2-enyl-diphosphate synthase
LKASDVQRTVAAYRLLAKRLIILSTSASLSRHCFHRNDQVFDRTWHFVHEGIGDTIRVSLAAEPQEEVRVALEILKSLELRKRGVTVVACPTLWPVDVDNFVGIVDGDRAPPVAHPGAAASFNHGRVR